MFTFFRSSWRAGVLAVALAGAGWGSRAEGAYFTYTCVLSGPAESPPNASPGMGTATVIYDTTAHTLHVTSSFSLLLGQTTAAHIHAATAVAGVGTAGVATTTPSFAGFPLGVTSGLYDNILDLTQSTSYNPSYVTANGGFPTTAEAAFAAALAAGRAYFNIHTSAFPVGEIRGFLTLVPTLGRCCDSLAACTIQTPTGCGAGGWSLGGTCTPNPCPGVCCDAAGGCSSISQTACGGGIWSNVGACSPNPCIGTCCGADGACVMLSQVGCGAGSWSTGGACAPSPCPGACCTGTTCTVKATAAACGSGYFLGTRTACSATGRYGPVNLCCSADFNNSGAANVADIFAYLAKWFAGCP